MRDQPSFDVPQHEQPSPIPPVPPQTMAEPAPAQVQSSEPPSIHDSGNRLTTGSIAITDGTVHGPVVGTNVGTITTWYHQPRRRHPLLVALRVLATLIAIATSVIISGTYFPPFQQVLYEQGFISTVSPEQPGETLILIAPFFHTEGVKDTDPHNRIQKAIHEAVQDLDLHNVRVEVAEGPHLRANDRVRAEAFGNKHQASIVIWGEDTGVAITINYLNLRQPDFDAAEATIDETTRSQLANPQAYASFITKDLPNQLTFLALFTVGQSAYSRAAYAEAIPIIEEAVSKLDPGGAIQGSADAYFRLGWLYQTVGKDAVRVITVYNEVLRLQPDYDAAYNNRGIAYDDQGKLEAAIADYSEAITRKPDDPEVYNNRGIAYQKQGKLEAAIDDHTQAITRKSDFAKAYTNRGNAYAAQGKLETAIADYSEAITRKPDFAEAYYNRGNAYQKQGKLEAAIADYSEAITRKPHYAEAYTNRGIAYQKQRKLEAAIDDHTQAITRKSDFAKAYTNRGNAYAAQGKLEAAIADYSEAITRKSDDAKAYNNRGVAYAAQGKLETAIADYSEAITLKPDFAEAYTNRGVAHTDQGKLEAAIDDHTQAIQLKSDYAEAYTNRSSVYGNKGKLDTAITEFDQAIKLDPSNPLFYANRGLAYAAQGKLEAAIADYTHAIEIKPDLAEPYYGRGRAYKALKNTTAAQHDLQRAADLGYIPAQKELSK